VVVEMLRLDQEGNYHFEDPQTNLHYETRIKEEHTNTSLLQVFIEPDEDEKLRTRSIPAIIDNPILKIYLQQALLSTMYAENGIGIASIQCGIPLRAFVVDIPCVKSINGKKCLKNNPRYVREAISEGKTLKVIETRPKYVNGAVETVTLDRVIGPSPLQVDEVVMITRTPIFLINPQILSTSSETIMIPEGCLSVPADFVSANFGSDNSVERPLGLEISFTNLCGETEVLKVDGSLGEHEKWLSRCLQHEYDHLEGILFTDRLAPSQLH
jgi:peptide deformylase